MSGPPPRITILTSGIGLGVYIPSLLIQVQLGRMDLEADVEVLEEYYLPDSQRLHLAHKEAFRKNFALALIANRMARGVEHCVDRDRIDLLIRSWAEEGREDFIVWSGFWLPVLETYQKKLPGMSLNIDLCRIDAEISASFRAHSGLHLDGNDIWLWNWSERKIIREIPITTRPSVPVPFSGRENRLIVHGGGWGLGTYQNTLPELEGTKYSLDVVVHDASEAGKPRPGDRRLIINSEWRPWHRRPDNRHSFPAVGEVKGSSEVKYRVNDSFHEMYNVIRRCKAIVSKPGGCTLIDSLNSATPVVLLDAFGQSEACNAALWEYLGYGISFSTWRASGYSESLLERLHSNIIARANGAPGYPREYAERFTNRWRRRA